MKFGVAAKNPARVIALGHPARSDDGAALQVARRLPPGLAEVILAGRPGAGLLDLLDAAVPTVLIDVVRAGLAPGALVRLTLAEAGAAALTAPRVSSHGLGPGDALRLAKALGRALPRGWFVGVEGDRFDPGEQLSPAVEAALDGWLAATVAAVEDLCTSTDS